MILDDELSNILIKLEKKIFKLPQFQQIIFYKNINLFDASYTEIYRGFKKMAFDEAFSKPAKKDVKKNRNFFKSLKFIVYLIFNYLKFNFYSKVRKNNNDLIIIRSPKNKTGLEIIEELQIKYNWEVFFCSWSKNRLDELAHQKFKKIYLNFFGGIHFRILKKTHEKRIKDIVSIKDLEIILTFLNDNYKFYQSEAYVDILINHLALSCVYIDIYEDLFKRLEPKILVLLNDNIVSERCAALVAKEMSIKSVLIQHGLFMGYTYRSFISDIAMVWGKHSKNFLMRRNYNKEKIIEIGYPVVSSKKKQKVPQANQEKLNILFLGQHDDDCYLMKNDYVKILKELKKTIVLLHNYNFIIRPHPKQSKEDYSEIFSKNLKNLKFEKHNSLSDAFASSNIVITVFSTAAIEAMNSKIPIITLDINKSISPFKNFTIRAHDSESLGNAIISLSNNEILRNEMIYQGNRYYKNYINQKINNPVSFGAKIINEFDF